MTLWFHVPVGVEDEVEGREGEFCFEEGGEFVLNGASPAADKDDELVHDPGNAATRGAGIVARKSLLLPDVFVRFRVDDERIAIPGSSLHSGRGHRLFPDAEKRVGFRIVPEDTDTGGVC